MIRSGDAQLGLLALLIAGFYWVGAGQIQHSLLTDAVGADGVPRVLAYAMGAIGLALFARAIVRRKREASAAEPAEGVSGHLKAAGLLAILILYTLAVPHLGYLISVAGLVAAVAVYAGARPSFQLAAVAIGGAAVLWALFRLLLRVPMPTGVLGWG